MFTGVVEAMAKVHEVGKDVLILERPRSFTDLKLGSSICVAGACLSVAQLGTKVMRFDLSRETLKRTKLGALKKGDRVNLERAMSASSRIEGHLVQGHVDATGRVKGVKGLKGVKGSELMIEYPKELRGLIVEKGSIAVDGVSLTVASLSSSVRRGGRREAPILLPLHSLRSVEESLSFTVVLIPHTLKTTTLGAVKKGDRVNLEVDVLMKYVLPSSPA